MTFFGRPRSNHCWACIEIATGRANAIKWDEKDHSIMIMKPRAPSVPDTETTGLVRRSTPFTDHSILSCCLMRATTCTCVSAGCPYALALQLAVCLAFT